MSCLKYLRTQSCLRFRLTSYAKQPSLNGSQVTTPGFFFTHFIGFQFCNALLCFGPHFCCLPRTPSRVNMQKPYTKSTRKNFVNQIAEWDVWTNWFTLTIKKCMLLIAQVQRRSPLEECCSLIHVHTTSLQFLTSLRVVVTKSTWNPPSIFKHVSVVVTKFFLHESRFPYSLLWAIIHMLVQVHLQVALSSPWLT